LAAAWAGEKVILLRREQADLEAAVLADKIYCQELQAHLDKETAAVVEVVIQVLYTAVAVAVAVLQLVEVIILVTAQILALPGPAEMV
jgi:hypothetical protein